jgi:DNA-directed RNA polymerase beta subunit
MPESLSPTLAPASALTTPSPAVSPSQPPVAAGAALPLATPTTHREFDDVSATRSAVFQHVLKAVQTAYPLANEQFELHVADPHYDDPRHFSIQEEKDAILRQQTLDWKLRGTWQLKDRKSGQVVAQLPKIVARVPYMTRRGTFIYRGNEYTVANQQRLRPGIYARQKDNGELESHVNLIPGTGPSFRLHMEPETGVFRMQVGQGHVPLFTVLKALGAQDRDIVNHWGAELYQKNALKDDPSVLRKVLLALGDPATRRAYAVDHTNGLRQVFAKMSLDPQVSERNLGKAFSTVDQAVLLRASQKLMHVHQGKEEPDDRDSQANQTLHGPEDLFAERISRDAGRTGRTLLWKSTRLKHLDHIKSGALTPQVHGVLLTSGLGQPLAEINPVEILDQLHRVTRLGEGGIPSRDSIPAEARNVQPSQLGYIDPVLGPESEAVGVDTRLASGTLKGSDGLLYSRLLNARNGKIEPVAAREATTKVLAFPNDMRDPTRSKVRAIVNGRIRYVDRAQVDYAVPEAEHMLALGSNLVPHPAGIKGGRLLMAGKMVRQALPLRDAQAPLVQAATLREVHMSPVLPSESERLRQVRAALSRVSRPRAYGPPR